jgi:hypothetical protein
VTLAAMLLGAGLPLGCATSSSGSSGGSDRARNQITREEFADIDLSGQAQAEKTAGSLY